MNISNGVNHDVILFAKKDVRVNRKQQAFLNVSDAKPELTIKQEKALSVRTGINSTGSQGAIDIFLPDMVGAQIDILRDYVKYDIIIVSKLYAELASKLNIAYDYLDRLYVPVPLYDFDPKIKGAKIIGSAGLKKAYWFKQPTNYIMDLNCGVKPSCQAMLDCISYYQANIYYYDAITCESIRKISRYLQEMRGNY